MVEKEVSEVVVLTVNDKTYRLTPGEFTSKIVRQVRAATGHSLQGALQQFGDDPDIDIVATLCYAAVLQAGGNTPFEEIEASINYGSTIEVEVEEEDEESKA